MPGVDHGQTVCPRVPVFPGKVPGDGGRETYEGAGKACVLTIYKVPELACRKIWVDHLDYMTKPIVMIKARRDAVNSQGH